MGDVRKPSSDPTLPTFHIQSVRYGSRSSRAEQLQLERKRVVGCGITEYGLHEKSGRFIFTAGNSVYHVTDDSARVSGHVIIAGSRHVTWNVGRA